MKHASIVLMTEFVTPDTKRFVISRPDNFQWTPGQGVEMIINTPPWDKEDGHPFTPTGKLNDRVLEFTIKRYADHHGLTDQLHTLEPGHELLISEPFGTITYKGKGTFIAAGAGITPFLAIFRDLVGKNSLEGNRLIYSNKRPADIICEKELHYYFGDEAMFTCTRDRFPGYLDQRINQAFLKEKIVDLDERYYICGPESFVEDVKRILAALGVRDKAFVFEE